MLRVGERAPEIDALASDGSQFVLSKQGGLCTVIYFFPKAFTPGCTIETKRFRDNHAEIALAGARIVGVSTDDLQTQCKFAGELKTPFPMVSDADQAISRAYGVLWPILGVARRVTFIVSPEMVIEAVFSHEIQIKKHRDDVLAFVDAKFRATRPAAVAGPLAMRGMGRPSRAVPASDARRGADALRAGSHDSSRAPRADAGPATRQLLAGRFELERQIGGGAAGGDVYRALDRAAGLPVAVRILQRGPILDETRFEREAGLFAELRHPGIIEHVAHGLEMNGSAYVATEWLQGETLARRFGRKPLTILETLTLGTRLAAALGAAHARGLLHRDIKPSNVFLVGGHVEQAKLIDFDILRPSIASNHVAVSGSALGTPGYLAPEQARGGEVDERADVFSLGCVLFRCLTGRAAFTGEAMVAELLGTAPQEVPAPRLLNPAVPEALSELVARMLSKSPHDRPAHGHAVALELAPLAGLTAAPWPAEAITGPR